MVKVIALLDACVLYPAPIRDLLMQLARQDTYQARWSEDIHAEWIRSVLADRPDLKPAQLARTRLLMDRHVPDALVTGFADIVETLTLPDPDDRHVLAAAIAGGAQMIVTFNLKDFPDAILSPHEIRAVHPDDFLLGLMVQFPGSMKEAVRAILDRLRSPPVTAADYPDILRRVNLPQTASALEQLGLASKP